MMGLSMGHCFPNKCSVLLGLCLGPSLWFCICFIQVFGLQGPFCLQLGVDGCEQPGYYLLCVLVYLWLLSWCHCKVYQAGDYGYHVQVRYGVALWGAIYESVNKFFLLLERRHQPEGISP